MSWVLTNLIYNCFRRSFLGLGLRAGAGGDSGLITILEGSDNDVSLSGVYSSGGPKELSDSVRRRLASGKGRGDILRLKGVSGALESMVVF